MDDNARSTIVDIKNRVRGMLDERRRLAHAEATPSKYWSDSCSFFDYMLDLPERHFERLRLHTYHLTGDNYQTYYYDFGKDALIRSWRALTKQVPPECILYEPEDGIGFRVGAGLVSSDTLRFQQVVNTLYHEGVLTNPAVTSNGRRCVLEIGAGYGGLAHHLSKLIAPAQYVIVDLPETLLYSASYLALHNPTKRLYTYGPEDHLPALGPQESANADFILLPNYRLDALRSWRFDLVINLASFQEMRTDQVQQYLAFIAETCRGVMFSSNQDAQDKNMELENLSAMLRNGFRCSEVPPTAVDWRVHIRRLLKGLATSVGLLEKPSATDYRRPLHVYLCRPL